MMIRRVRIACRIPKATNTNSEYAILIAFSQQKWLTRTRKNDTLYVYCLSSVFYSLSVSLTRPCDRWHVVYCRKISEDVSSSRNVNRLRL